MKISFNLLAALLLLIILASCSITKRHISRSEKKYEELKVIKTDHQLDSSTIHLRKVGTGANKLLLIHGFGPVPQIQWENLVKELHSDFTLYIPDLIYFGESRSMYNQFDPRFQARQLYQLLHKEKADQLSVCGVSYGGLIAAIFAHQYPEMTENLILIDALSRFASKKYADSLAEKNNFRNINEVLVPQNGKALKTLFELTFYKPYKYPAFALNKPSRLLYSDQRDQKKELLNYLFSHEQEMKKWDFNFKRTVVIIWGKEDILIPLNSGYALKDFYQNAELFVIPNAAHAVNMENADKVGAIIKKIKNPSNDGF